MPAVLRYINRDAGGHSPPLNENGFIFLQDV